MYVSGIPFEQLGFPELGPDPIPELSEGIMNATPGLVAAAALLLGGMHWIMKRRAKAQEIVEPVELDQEELS
jgi:hypothetical protein